MKHLVYCFVLIAGTATGETCPEAPDHLADVDDLIAQAQDATSQSDGRRIAGEMWKLWTDAPDRTAQLLLDQGMRRRESYDLAGAYAEFDALVRYCPDYAEGYNQRAFANYLRQNFAEALVDLDRALALSPNHVAALSGKALTLMGLERMGEARIALTAALKLNPWLAERNLVAQGGPLAPLGQDI